MGAAPPPSYGQWGISNIEFPLFKLFISFKKGSVAEWIFLKKFFVVVMLSCGNSKIQQKTGHSSENA